MMGVVAPPEPPPVAATGSQTSALIRLARQLTRWQSRFPLLQLVVLATVYTWGATQVVGFASGPSLRAMLVIAALLGLTALGQTLVILLGGLDLAVGGYVTVGAVAAAQLGGKHHWPLVAVALLTVVVCSAAGGVCGSICHRFQVQSLVVTLGMYSVLISGILVLTDSRIVDPPPAVLTRWTSVPEETFGLPVPPVVVIWLVVTALATLGLERTPAGRRLYATGANPRAAAGVLIRTGRVWTVVFALSAALTGLAGMLVAGFGSGATPTTGDPYLFSGLAAVIVGGTALGTARGDYLRTALGALILTALITILAGQGFDEGDTRILYGVAILVVVLVYGRQPRLRDRL